MCRPVKRHCLYFSAIIATGLLLLAKPSIGRAQQPADGHLPARVIVQFKGGQDEAKVNNVLARHGARVKKHVRSPAMKAKGHPGLHVLETVEPVEQAVAKLRNEPAVEFAEPDYVVKHQAEPADGLLNGNAVANDTYYTAGYLWGLKDTGANSFGARASAAWAAGYTGTNSVYIGVIDEGVQWQHPDLTPNMWNNPFDPVDGMDNDGNGYPDDTRGWDFYSGDNSVYDAGGDNHGTHVAGTIAAAGGNGRGVVGVNWKATVISAKFLGAEGGYVSDAIAAIDYFVDLKERHGLNIVALNNSWGGGGYSQALHDAVLRAAKAGILFVAAAGNGDQYGRALNNDAVASYPSNYDTTRSTSTESAAGYDAVIAVAAIDETGALGTFSNFGSRTVHIGAPGVDVLSTVANGYAYMDGTSMATPHVTGGVALYASTHPNVAAKDIRQAILQAATPTAALAGKSTSGARLNLAQVIAPSGASSGGGTTSPSPVAAQFHSPATTNGQFRVQLKGVVGNVYEVQVSPDLSNWTTVITVTNTTGTISLADPISSGWPRKFYRTITR